MREVFAREHPDQLLHLLARSEGPVPYTQARETLALQPEQFARALRTLEKWGLVQLRAVPRRERPDHRRRVRIELTVLGHAVVRLHDGMEQQWDRIQQEEGLTGLLAAAS
jgi:DNA-binding MarR family transcriptional regulator